MQGCCLSHSCVPYHTHSDGWESASMSEEEEEDDGEWIHVQHSSDEMQQEVVGVLNFFF